LLFTFDANMAPKQKMRLANEKHSKNVMNRGNVPKSLVSTSCIE
jgi:Ribosome associated membrane protein RAMP4